MGPGLSGTSWKTSLCSCQVPFSSFLGAEGGCVYYHIERMRRQVTLSLTLSSFLKTNPSGHRWHHSLIRLEDSVLVASRILLVCELLNSDRCDALGLLGRCKRIQAREATRQEVKSWHNLAISGVILGIFWYILGIFWYIFGGHQAGGTLEDLSID